MMKDTKLDADLLVAEKNKIKEAFGEIILIERVWSWYDIEINSQRHHPTSRVFLRALEFVWCHGFEKASH